ncbi:AMP-binding protein [Nocardia aurea]|uniref:AMP-binding protein n=1 Tax=Nocardia aurea TaxID=2144174 RepID=UPI000D68BFA2|nr:AMP-binding protein [Nocardia aurea]
MGAPSETRIPPLHALRVLVRAGVLNPWKPGRLLRLKRDADRWGPMPAAIKAAVADDPDRVGLVDDLGEMTYRELDTRTDAIAAAWSARGIGPEAVIGLMGRNNRAAVETVLAAAKLGATLVMLNSGFGGPQLREVVAREGVTVLVHDAEFAGLVPGLHGLALYEGLRAGDGAATATTLDELVAEGRGASPPEPAQPGAIILLTAGTTGLPKGAPRRVRSTDGVVQLLDRIPLRVRESTYVAVPLFHAIGLFHMMTAFSFGSRVVLSNRFDARHALELMERHRCTAVVAVPTMLKRILDLGEEEIRRHDLSALRIFFSGGSLLSERLSARAAEVLGDVMYNMYGSTEVSVCTVATPEDLRISPGSAGKPPVGVVVRLLDAEDRVISAPGTTGAIHVATRLSFSGYTDGGNKRVVDGMMSTGDVGHFDAHGNLFVDGREDDMIVSGGENVYPREVEDLLLTRDDVAEVCVCGVPDEEYGQRLAAHVVPRPGASPAAEEIRAFVKANLARHKVPRDVVFHPRLPRNAMGKVLRSELISDPNVRKG